LALLSNHVLKNFLNICSFKLIFYILRLFLCTKIELNFKKNIIFIHFKTKKTFKNKNLSIVLLKKKEREAL